MSEFLSSYTFILLSLLAFVVLTAVFFLVGRARQGTRGAARARRY